MPEFDEAAAAVAAVLLEHWDLVGVRDTDEDPASEYRFEAVGVVRLLATGAGVDAVTAHLREQAASLGAARDDDRDRRAAEALVALVSPEA